MGESRSNNAGLDCFKQHGIDRPVNVEQLIKCKMQDNLEFLQWSKRYWDQYYPGGDYDANARRLGSGAPAPAAAAPRASAGAARRGTTPTIGGARAGKSAAGGAGNAALQQENNTLKETVQGLERERDFYFSKLRDIELLVQQACEEDPEIERQEDGLIKHIQSILYSTEDGFEIPAEAEVDDQETF
ncbi:putative Microtubule integrity protein mal3 [Glarea lozoyensis 74030]|uniref:Putative Microtubule integrity protein mal3 n=1 Tax=Glarea lozoyensis (strain ATCC 74030 / MF5533) TaxID=1104152 RepID=H0EFW9_GLAL7|nr:putative Microtubule integrity protein mal3 [Glarea lozoyensis 74030]